MGLRDMFKRKPQWEQEQEKRRRYEKESARLGYELASAKRQASLAEREAEIRRLRAKAEKLKPKQSGVPDFGSHIDSVLFGAPEKQRAKSGGGGYDVLDYNPFDQFEPRAEKKGRERSTGGYDWL